MQKPTPVKIANGVRDSSTVTLSLSQSNPSWSVDFGIERKIVGVVILQKVLAPSEIAGSRVFAVDAAGNEQMCDSVSVIKENYVRLWCNLTAKSVIIKPYSSSIELYQIGIL